MKAWPDTLAGRTLALLLGVMLLLVIGSALLLEDERKQRFFEHHLHQQIKQIITLVRVFNDHDRHQRKMLLNRFDQLDLEIELSSKPAVPRLRRHHPERRFERYLRHALDLSRQDVRMHLSFKDQPKGSGGVPDRPGHRQFRQFEKLALSIRLEDGTWLNIETNKIEQAPPWTNRTLQLLGLLLVLLIVSGLIIARRMAKPMAQLAQAAEQFGKGQPVDLPVSGPREVRRTIQAFNLMQERLHRQIKDRSAMLAAVAHDLRTPITTLRLRAEYIEDPAMRDKTLANLTEMEDIISETLAFARDEAADEQARATDIAALLQALVDDQSDLGADAGYHGPDRLVLNCRPVSLRRALNNLIDNAMRYGKRADVTLERHLDRIDIRIEDQGPGIPEALLDKVMKPFFRLEESRNRETGGTGLGLAVANSIVLAHGGTLTLSNPPKGGLKVILRLPL